MGPPVAALAQARRARPEGAPNHPGGPLQIPGGTSVRTSRVTLAHPSIMTNRAYQNLRDLYGRQAGFLWTGLFDAAYDEPPAPHTSAKR